MRERPHVRSALAGADRDRIIYDLTGIDRQYDVLRRELPGVEVRFAMKACPVDEVLASLADRGAGFDAASPGEIRQALRTGVAPRRIHYGNTIKSDAEIADAYALGVTTFATDSVEDVRAIARHAPGARVFCRLSTSGEGALWGLTAKCGTEDPVPVLEEARRQGLVPAGLSVHVGSQQMTVRAWERALGDLAAVLPRLKDLEFVNLGGGLPAEGYLDRAGAPMTPPTAEMFAAIRAGLRRLREVAGGELDFLVEPGRYLVADHGTIRAHVVRLTVRRQPWLYLSCGRFNGLYEADQIGYRLEFPTRSGGRTVPAVVAGPTCDSDDNLGTAPTPVPADLASGDPVWIHGAGAYAISYMTRGFNGYDPLPCISVRAEHVRPITPGDWSSIAELEAGAYTAKGLSEDRAVLESRARSSPSTSFVLDTGGRVGGYVLALPYPPRRFPQPDRPEHAVHRSSNLHLHDIVVDDRLRGRGWAKRMLRHLTDTARSSEYEQISLIAVGGTSGFWSTHGYRPHPEVDVPPGYGPGAVYMSRPITDGS
ncbi:GNAT family N-acetyltransferase [Pseudosporangium ferrugineum]|uniref:ornithine decarboxylase n=1 Tax=Pseudosporangium ferrugineum TaxID=439699 RepID=A0A2T0S7Q2_9ACTN|nr:GNAT family N-acetyltransferase [Pseudosporangium ferrugineum]PRY29457.1 ornithine decarboxylase [Pseudosporangium ferrugineum]